jgi:hypothetical protein
MFETEARYKDVRALLFKSLAETQCRDRREREVKRCAIDGCALAEMLKVSEHINV